MNVAPSLLTKDRPRLNADAAARSRSGLGDVSFVPSPPGLGLMRDRTFIELLLRTTPPENLHTVRHRGQVLARFNRVKSSVGPLPLVGLYPLGGVSLCPLAPEVSWSDEMRSNLAKNLAESRGWDYCRFCALGLSERELLPPALAKEGFRMRECVYPSFIIDGIPSFDDYLKQRSKSFRSSIKASNRKALQKGFAFGNAVDIQEWKLLYKRRGLAVEGSDYSVTSGFHSFLERVIEAYRREGRLVELVLASDNQVAAAGLGIISEGILHFYQTAHDPAFEDIRPGALVFLRMIEEAFVRGLTSVAFISDAPYLRLFTNQAVNLCELEIFSRGPLGRGLWMYRQLRRSRPTH